MDRPEIIVLTMNERDQSPPAGFADAEPGSVVVFEEPLFEQAGDWKPGAQVGTLRATCIIGVNETAHCDVVFVFDGRGDENVYGRGTIAAGGSIALSVSGDGTRDIGDGSVPVIGGTGTHRSRTGELSVEVLNPHRWRIQG